MSNGILLQRELSILYFVASILFLIILIAMYFAADYSNKQLLQCLAIFGFVLGSVLFLGGIVVLVVELPSVEMSVLQSWAGMS